MKYCRSRRDNHICHLSPPPPPPPPPPYPPPPPPPPQLALKVHYQTTQWLVTAVQSCVIIRGSYDSKAPDCSLTRQFHNHLTNSFCVYLILFCNCLFVIEKMDFPCAKARGGTTPSKSTPALCFGNNITIMGCVVLISYRAMFFRRNSHFPPFRRQDFLILKFLHSSCRCHGVRNDNIVDIECITGRFLFLCTETRKRITKWSRTESVRHRTRWPTAARR